MTINSLKINQFDKTLAPKFRLFTTYLFDGLSQKDAWFAKDTCPFFIPLETFHCQYQKIDGIIFYQAMKKYVSTKGLSNTFSLDLPDIQTLYQPSPQKCTALLQWCYNHLFFKQVCLMVKKLSYLILEQHMNSK